jgi:hypothetical protein
MGALPAFAQAPVAQQHRSEQHRSIALSDLRAHAAEEPAISRIVAQGIMKPIAPGKFDPDGVVTRDEFAASLQHMFNLPAPARPIRFPDLSPRSPNYAAIQAAAPYMNAQILCPGCLLSRRFLPDEAASRGVSTLAIVRILVAKKKLPLPSPAEADHALANVTDAKGLAPEARPYFATALSSGILTLRPGNKTELGLEHTRAELAAQLDHVQRTLKIAEVKP